MSDAPAGSDGSMGLVAEARHALEILRREGVTVTARKGLARAGVLRRLQLLVLPMGEHPVSEFPEDLVCRELAPGDAERQALVLELNPYSELGSQAELDARLKRGYRCFVVWDDSRPIASAWAAHGMPVPVPYLSCELPLLAREAGTFESYTAPAARGKGIGATLRVRIAHQLADEGAELLLAMVSTASPAPVRMVAKLGYEPVGTLTMLKIGGWRRARLRIDDDSFGVEPRELHDSG